tara:strand:- start:2880 stop:3905 length:1026 start_codon:yes stop_codon:yes gene_type:complete
MSASWKKILVAGDISDTHIGSENKTITSSGRSLTLGDANSGVGVFSIQDSSANSILSVSHVVDENFVTVFGDLSIKDDGSADDNSTLKIYNGGTNFIGFKSPSLSGPTTFTLPDSDGNANQVLKTDGSGNLSWVDQSGGSVDGSGSNGKVALWSDSNTLTFDAGITYDGTADSVTVGSLTATSSGSGNGGVSGVFGGFSHIQVGAVMSPNSTTDGAFGIGTRMFEKLAVTAGIEAGHVYYYRDGWALADKDNTDSINLLAVATDLENSGAEMVAEGFVRMDSGNGFTGQPAGTPLYIGDNGDVTTSAPTGQGDIARVVGYVINASSKIIYFKPDNTWVTVD